MTRTIKHTKTNVATRIHKGVEKELNKLCEELDKTRSDILREAITTYLDRHTEADIDKYVQKVFDNSEALNKAYSKHYYMEKQNFLASVKLKELTFLQYMDKNLASVYLANKPHVSTEDLEEMLRETLNVLKDRAETHGFEQQWQERKEDPISYVEEFLDRQAQQEKAFNDFMDSI